MQHSPDHSGGAARDESQRERNAVHQPMLWFGLKSKAQREDDADHSDEEAVREELSARGAGHP